MFNEGFSEWRGGGEQKLPKNLTKGFQEHGALCQWSVKGYILHLCSNFQHYDPVRLQVMKDLLSVLELG
jgi:hypothetical protein